MNIDYIIIYSIITGILIASSLASVGCIVLWRNVGYFGEAISHASLIGVILSVVFSIDITISLIVFALGFSLVVFLLRNVKISSLMSLIVSYGLLSFGVVFLSLYKRINFDIMSLLFGDVLLVNNVDLWFSVIIITSISLWFWLRWDQILYSSLNQEMAFVSGVNISRISLEFFIIVSLVVALSIKIVGILMVTAMLIIPAAAASNISSSPKEMVFKSVLIAIISLVLGFVISFILDTTTGPTIVLVSGFIFISLLFCKRLF